MKKLNLFLFAFFALPLSVTAQTVVTYTYDDAGNRTSRTSSVEVAAANETPAFEKSNIQVLNPAQYFINANNMLCSSSYWNQWNYSGFIEKYWKNKSGEASVSPEPAEIIAGKENRKHSSI